LRLQKQRSLLRRGPSAIGNGGCRKEHADLIGTAWLACGGAVGVGRQVAVLLLKRVRCILPGGGLWGHPLGRKPRRRRSSLRQLCLLVTAFLLLQVLQPQRLHDAWGRHAGRGSTDRLAVSMRGSGVTRWAGIDGWTCCAGQSSAVLLGRAGRSSSSRKGGSGLAPVPQRLKARSHRLLLGVHLRQRLGARVLQHAFQQLLPVLLCKHE
jgi:hypothetical protein